MKRIHKGDEVIVTTGRSKGTRGHVLQVLDSDRLLVENVNMIKRHTKGNPQAGQPGGIIEKEAPIQVSNIAIFNPATSKADRVGYQVMDGSKKVRVYKSSGEQIDV